MTQQPITTPRPVTAFPTHLLLWLAVTLLALIASSAAANDYVRIESRWKPDQHLHTENGPLQAGRTQPGWWSADWTVERVRGEPFVRLRNRHSGGYLHAERERLEVGPIQNGWWSAMWELQPVRGTDFVRLRNRWLDRHVHIENGPVALGAINDGWWSAMWQLRDSQAAASSRPAPARPVSASPSRPANARPSTSAAAATRAELPPAPPRQRLPAGRFSKATKHAATSLCPRGSFFDPRNGGECWRCPAGTQRTLAAVTSSKACESVQPERTVRATYQRQAGCPRGSFLDPRNGGECWRCPAGKPRRTAYAVTDARACATKEIFGERLGRAEFLGSATCSSGHFFDPRNGGECWSCPAGSNRTLNAVTSAAACAYPASSSFAKASFAAPFLCPQGQFLDIGNGACWSCPAGWYRTVNRVNGPKACTNRPEQIFAADPGEFCRSTLGALAKGREGAEKLSKEINQIIDPLMAPLNEALREAQAQVRSPRELDQLLEQAARALDGDALRTVSQLSADLDRNQRALLDLLLDKRLVCDGNGSRIESALRRINLGPGQGIPVRRGERVYSAYSIGVALSSGRAAGLNVAIVLITDFAGSGGVFLGLSPQASNAPPGAALNLGASYSAYESVQDIAGPYPDLELGLSASGEAVEKLFAKINSASARAGAAASVPNGLQIAYSTENLGRIGNRRLDLPTIGVTKSVDLGGGGNSRAQPPKLEVSAGAGWVLPMLTWGR